jgi:hypothetical protein
MRDSFRAAWRHLAAGFPGPRRPRAGKARPRRPLTLDALEDRAVPTIIIKPNFGVETDKSNDNDEFGIQPKIYLVYWGSYWSGAGASEVASITNAATQMVATKYFTLTNQYGADGTGMSIGGVAFDNSDPSSGSFDPEDDVDDVVENLIDNGTFPESDADASGNDNGNGNDHSRIYVVITPPNVNSKLDTSTSQVFGLNSVESDTDFGTTGFPLFLPTIDSDDIGLNWVQSGRNGAAPNTGPVPLGPTGAPDSFSLTFSHEVAEIMSDWDSEGYKVNPGPAPGAPGGSGNQIGDYEGNSYQYRMSNGVDVQPLWSRADTYPGGPGPGSWAVYDENNQKFFLDPTGNWVPTPTGLGFTNQFALTIQGDQLGVDDVITVGTVPAGQPQAGGVTVTENGETVTFDPGQITGITINAKTGSNTINFNKLPAGVTLTMDSIGGTIKLAAPNTLNTWNITGAGSGTLNGNAFSNVTSLTGGTNTDAFNFQPGGSITGNVDGGAGANSLSYAGVGGPVTVNLQARTGPGIGGTFVNIGSVTGSGGSDTLTGPAGSTTWNLTGFNAGTVGGVTFASFENLAGNTGDDTFTFQPGGSISGNLNGGGAVSGNSLDYSALFGAVTVNLQAGTTSRVGGTFAGVNRVTGGAGFDTLVGPDAGATWSLDGPNFGTVAGVTYASFENLTGGAGTDRYLFQPGGGVSGNIDGGGGANTLDYSALAGPVTVNFTLGTASGVGGSIANITKAIGSASGADTIVGPDAAWTISGADSGVVNAITYVSFENLVGSPDADTFTFLPAGSVSGNLDGGGGADTLDYHNLAGPIAVNLQTHKAPLIGGTFANITGLVGSAGGDSLTGPDGGATWTLTGANAGSVAGVGFTSFENLVGGDGDDTFVFAPGGGVSGNVNGGGGNNTLDYHLLSTPVTIGLGTNTATGIGGTFTNVNGFVGGSGVNTVLGPDSGATWTITGVNGFKVLGFTFGGFQNITAGAGPDTFAFLTGGRLDGAIDGGGGVNNLTYAGYTGPVIVDLLIHTATGAGGGIFNIQNVTGGNGDNMLVGDGNANVFVGGTGRNILIGDGGSDRLTGGGHDNILVGDSTDWDANLTALQAIFAEWTRTDQSFEQRVAHLISTGNNGLNGVYSLDKKVADADGSVDTLIGGDPTGLNWFFVTHQQDVYTPHNPGDHITQL